LPKNDSKISNYLTMDRVKTKQNTLDLILKGGYFMLWCNQLAHLNLRNEVLA